MIEMQWNDGYAGVDFPILDSIIFMSSSIIEERFIRLSMRMSNSSSFEIEIISDAGLGEGFDKELSPR